jgi:DMSO reductase family type II enzyme heme b subunit
MGKENFSVKLLIPLVLILLLPIQAFPEDKGKVLYDKRCAQCHGYKGDGKGYAADFVFPKPRDFTKGTYKFRTTPSGEPPMDEDIIRSIKRGNPGTSMPPWKLLSDDEVKALADYLKKFSPETFTSKATPIKIGKEPSAADKLIEQGKKGYETAKCWECHGKAGRGDGQKGWQEKFKDDWGYKAFPTDQTSPWEYRNGSDVRDLFVTITAGIDGTPMTSYGDTLSDEQRWALAYSVKSQQLKRKLGIALRAKRVNGIPSSPEDVLWESVDYLDLPMAGQIISDPRDFMTMITNVRVRSVYTGSEAALMLEWSDKKPNRGDDGLPPDAARLQFPSKIPESSEKPYFFMGDKKLGVNTWLWKASDTLGVEVNAKGPTGITQQEKQDVKVTAAYKDGLYRIIFRRLLNTGDPDDPVFEIGEFIPFAVTLYDGQNHEENNKGAISAWYYLMLEPPTSLKAFVLPPLAFLATLGAGLTLRRKLRKKR